MPRGFGLVARGGGCLLVEALAEHGGVGAVRRAEGVVHVHVAQLRQRRAELLHLVLVGLDLLARRVDALALLLDLSKRERVRTRGGSYESFALAQPNSGLPGFFDMTRFFSIC